MYESLERGEIWRTKRRDPRDVLAHHGDCDAFLRRHHEDAGQAAGQGIDGVRAFTRYLHERIADARTLRLAWDHLAVHGGQAPGPNGHRYPDYSSSEIWGLCRAIAGALQNGTYRPGRAKTIWIPKESGCGQRPIVLLSIEDRVVQRAMAIILQPLLDPLFGDRSFGYRPKLNHLHALAAAEQLTLSQQRTFLVVDDIKDAFTNVASTRLVQVVRNLFPDEKLVALIQRVVCRPGSRGLQQGGSLSPLMLNIYLRHFLEEPWERQCPTVPLIRVADDLLALCTTSDEAQAAHDRMRKLLLPHGMQLKEGPKSAVRDLAAGQASKWLGFDVTLADDHLACALNKRAWRRLDMGLALAHTKSDSSLRAYRLIQQWLSHRGPCYAGADVAEVCDRIRKLARRHGFEEIPSAGDMAARFQLGYARWCKLRKAPREKSSCLQSVQPITLGEST